MFLPLVGRVWKMLPKGMRRVLARSLATNFTVSAAAIVTNDDGKVLLLNHHFRPTSGWGVPGGFVNSHEQPEAAVRRELKEEANIDLADVRVHRVRTFGRHIEIAFLAKGIGEAKVSSREIIELGWFSLDEMPEEMSLDQHFLIRNALNPPDPANEAS